MNKIIVGVLRQFALTAASIATLYPVASMAQSADVDPSMHGLPNKTSQQQDQVSSPEAGSTPAAVRNRSGHMLHPRDTSPAPPIADTQSGSPPGLIGDWLGARSWLSERGVAISAQYGSETAANFAGGTRKAIAESGQLSFGATADMGKIAGMAGGTLTATITWRRGFYLGDVAGLNTLMQVQEIYGRGQTVRFTELNYAQEIGDKVKVKFGRLNPGDDFAAFSCHFQNLSFCGAQSANLAGDYWYNWPIGQWGISLHGDVAKGIYVQGGVYQVNPRDLNTNFFVANWHGATGALMPFELGWTRGTDGGRVGSYKVGGWYSTVQGDDLLLDVNRQPIVLSGLSPLLHRGRYGVYVSVQQQLTGTSKGGKAVDGLSVFVNFTQADRATTLTDSQIAGGIFYKGLLPGVPGDVLGLAFARTNINGHAITADALVPGTLRRDAEYAAELYYSITPLHWLVLQPNVQWIHRPGGVISAPDVGVLGLKAAITF